MGFDHWVAWCLAPLAFFILVSGLDDLFIGFIWLAFSRRRFPWPAEADLDALPERPIAIFVPLWKEHRVIGRMLERNLASIRYTNFDVFVGCLLYTSDAADE